MPGPESLGGSDGFETPRLDPSMGDQVEMYLNVRNYDRVRYGFTEKYGYKLAEQLGFGQGEICLGEISLGLARYGEHEVYVWDGYMFADKERARYEQQLGKVLSRIPLDDHGIWMDEFLYDLSDVEALAREMGIR